MVVASLVARGYLVYGLLARLGALPAAGVAVVVHAVGYSGARSPCWPWPYC
jgi:hypothetical protein